MAPSRKPKKAGPGKEVLEDVQTELESMDPDNEHIEDEPDTEDPKALALAPSKEGRDALISGLVGVSEKVYGKGSLGTLRGKHSIAGAAVDVVDTGSLGLNDILGIGGYPRGRIVEIYGAESSGKTTLALHALANVQAAGGVGAFIDAEHALDPAYAEALGVNLDETLFSQPDNGEQALQIAEKLVSSGDVSIVIIDSVAALVPKSELEGEIGDHHPGAQARLMSQALRIMTGAAARTNTLVIFINQTRDKIGVTFGSPKTTTGGHALKFFASVRLEVTRTGSEKKGEEATGNTTKVKVTKNKLAPPFRTTEFTIVFGQGISQAGEIVDAALAAKLITKNGAWFGYKGQNRAMGQDRMREWLVNNPDMMKEIRDELSKRRSP